MQRKSKQRLKLVYCRSNCTSVLYAKTFAYWTISQHFHANSQETTSIRTHPRTQVLTVEKALQFISDIFEELRPAQPLHKQLTKLQQSIIADAESPLDEMRLA